MASFLRQIVAGPRSRHPEANLDLCYVTDNIIATSGPSAAYPSLAYRNPLSELVAFLDAKHGDQWCLFEFRAEGCGYPDDQVYGRIWHWPWPDHHPPPFALVPRILGSMREWLEGENGSSNAKHEPEDRKRVAVVHCKAGKGRSGTMAISYMMAHLGWTKTEALQRFTERRMRPGFGAGVSIPSQLRWLEYVERWSGHGGKLYIERPMEVTEVHVWGLRDAVTIAVEGYVEDGKKIEPFHVFSKEERDDFVEGAAGTEREAKPKQKDNLADVVQDVLRKQTSKITSRSRARSPRESLGAAHEPLPAGNATITGKAPSNTLQVPSESSAPSSASSLSDRSSREGSRGEDSPVTAPNVVLTPSKPIRLPSSDVNLAVERRAAVGYGFSTVTSVAHVWFNCFFEGSGPENYRESRSPGAKPSGVFTIDWDAMDGIKGSSRKGARAFDKVAVVWRTVGNDLPSEGDTEALPRGGEEASVVVPEPTPGQKIPPVVAADWEQGTSRGGDEHRDGPPGHEGEATEDKLRKDAAGSERETSAEVAVADENLDEEGVEGLRHGVVAPPDEVRDGRGG